jgi:hypothetical protein
MNFKTTYVLFGVLAVVLIAFILVLWMGPSSTENSDYVLPSLHKASAPVKKDDITRVEIERSRAVIDKDGKTETVEKNEKLVFVRDADSKQWSIVEPRDYRADSSAIDTLVDQIVKATVDKNAETINNPKQYGLDKPAEVITLIKESEPRREVKLNVGDPSPGKENAVLYVTSSDRSEVMAVKKSELASVKKTLADFRSRELLATSSIDIQAFALSERDKGKVVKELELKKSGEERWVYVKPSNYGDAQGRGTNPTGDKPPDNVETVLLDLSNLKVESDKDFVQDDVTDLGKYNLDPARNDIVRIEVERTESIKTSEKGEKTKETKNLALLVGIGAKVGDKKDQYYAYLDNPQHKDVIKISANSVAPLVKVLGQDDALRDRNLVDLGGFRKPDAIDVKNSWGTLEFRRVSSALPQARPGAPSRETWKLWRDGKSYAVDETAMQTLLSTLTAPNQVERFVDDPNLKNKLGVDKSDAVVVRIWTDSLPAEDKSKDEKKEDKKDEKKDKKPQPKDKDKPAFTLSFGGLWEGRAAVRRQRGDEKISTVVLVPTKLRDQVQAGPLAYLDKQLPPFNADRFDPSKNVTKLALTRDGTTYEISRENKPDAPWKIDKPADFAGRTADRAAIDGILRDLNGLRAASIEDDKIPSADKLAKWGLKDPSLKAVVTLTQDGKDKTCTFDFGKEKDATGVYLRTSLQDVIAVVGNNVVNTLKRELQDPTIFHFDASKVQEVKLTDWMMLQKQLGKNVPLTLTFKRAKSGAGWEVEPKDSIKPDAARLDEFVKNLADLKATRFIAHKAKPTAEQQLDPKDGGLQIELTVAGDKEPRKLTLTVGKAEADGYVAISNQLPGDIFVVRKDLFEKAKEKPAYFSGQ